MLSFLQGFVLKTLVELLQAFLLVPNILTRFKSQSEHLARLLDAYLTVKSLIVQKTKLTDDTAKLLLAILDSTHSNNESDKRVFICACISSLSTQQRLQTAAICLERLASIVCPTKAEPDTLLVLNKSPTQEEYIRGSMTKNPYHSAALGEGDGPKLFRDIKAKICRDLEIGGDSAMEDDNLMELLVQGQIIQLDLPIRRVFEQVWKPAVMQADPSSLPRGHDVERMVVVYRLQGLDGEATEPIVDSLKEEEEEELDAEVEYAACAEMADGDRLSVLLDWMRRLHDLQAEHAIGVLIAKVLYHCCKLRVNQIKMVELNALHDLTAMLDAACASELLVDICEPLLLTIEVVVRLTCAPFGVRGGDTSVPQAELAAAAAADMDSAMFCLVQKLATPALVASPKLVQHAARILAHMCFANERGAAALYQRFAPHVDVELGLRSEAPTSVQQTHVSCLVHLLDALVPSEEGACFKLVMLSSGVVGALVAYLARIFPEDKPKDSAEWAEGLTQPGLGNALLLLTGAARCCR